MIVSGCNSCSHVRYNSTSNIAPTSTAGGEAAELPERELEACALAMARRHLPSTTDSLSATTAFLASSRTACSSSSAGAAQVKSLPVAIAATLSCTSSPRQSSSCHAENRERSLHRATMQRSACRSLA